MKYTKTCDATELTGKMNEIIDWINLQEKKDDFIDALDDFKPKKLEVKHQEFQDLDDEIDDYFDNIDNLFSDKEMEVIKKCLKYCWHRYYQHTHAGIHSALSQEDKKIFVKIIEKL